MYVCGAGEGDVVRNTSCRFYINPHTHTCSQHKDSNKKANVRTEGTTATLFGHHTLPCSSLRPRTPRSQTDRKQPGERSRAVADGEGRLEPGRREQAGHQRRNPAQVEQDPAEQEENPQEEVEW